MAMGSVEQFPQKLLLPIIQQFQMKSKQPPLSNYVRIVYLKEMRPQRPKEEEQSSFTRNSLAYLSSLIQQDNKKRISQSTKVSVDWTKTQQLDVPIDSSHYIQNRNTAPVKVKMQESAKPKRPMLNRLLDGNQSERMPSIEIHRPKSKTFKLTYQGATNRQKQLKNSFMTFCNQLKRGQPSVQGKQIRVSEKRQPEKVIYLDDIVRRSSQKSKVQPRASFSQVRPPRLFQRPSIVYRKNFRQINNFDWGKIAEGGFDISSIKY